MGGQIVDASLIAAPEQRDIENEKKAIKEGGVPEDWKTNPANSATRTATRAGQSSSAKPRRSGTAPFRPSTSPPRCSAIGTMSRLTASTGRSAAGTPRTPRPTRGRGCAKGCSTRTTRRASSELTRPIARRRIRSSWRRMASSAASIAKSHRAARCRRRRGAPPRSNPKSAPGSSMSSRFRRTRWSSSSEPWASPAPRIDRHGHLVYNMKRLVSSTASSPPDGASGPAAPAQGLRVLRSTPKTAPGSKTSKVRAPNRHSRARC
jgi:hypothetical protein